jgi:hypothetical protein
VWLDLDQQELDDAYDQSKYAANLAQIVKRYATNSEQVRARLGAPKRLAHGSTPIEGLDLYPARKPNAPVHVFIVGYGTFETPEFQRQSRDFAAAVKAAGKPAELLVGEGYNHFEMPETLANPYGLLGRAALEQMKLAPV